MINQVVPKELLEKSSKILFIGPVAIGDFAYLHNGFQAMSEQYPNLKIDLWIDEYRGKSLLFRWKNKKHDIVCEWIESCPFFNKIYKNIGAWWNLLRFFKKLRQENYPIVVCLFHIRPSRTARFAKLISPSGFIVHAIKSVGFDPISDYFSYIFEKNFGIKIPQKKLSLNIDKKWVDQAQSKLLALGITPKHDRVIFLNSFAKCKKRSWRMENVIELIKKLKKEADFSNSSFFINAMPDKKELIETIIKDNSLKNAYVFTASKSFFELPAMISLCDLVISVDTSVIHLAFSLNIPLVGLYRQKTAMWAPKSEKCHFIYTKNKREWANDITVDNVLNTVKLLRI